MRDSFPSIRRLALRGAVLSIAAALFTTGVVGTVPSHTPAKVHINKHAVAARASTGFETTMASDTMQMVAFSWKGNGAATVQVRGLRHGQWTDWLTLRGDPDEGPDRDSPEHHDVVSTEPGWLGRDVSSLELKVTDGSAPDLQVHEIDTGDPVPSGSAFGVPAADASVPQPGIISRAEWGADEADSYTQPGCEQGVQYASSGVTNAFVHHTVNSNDYTPADSPALVRGIQAYHIFSNGWCDIGYNFLVDRYGQVFEGRRGGINKAVIGGHASGFNTGSTGVSLIGNFDIAPVPNAMYDALVRLLTWKLAYHGVDPAAQIFYTVKDNTGAFWPAGTVVVINTISGHRDVNQTACPGTYMEALLPRLRADVAAGVQNQQRDTRIMCDWNGDGTDTPAVFSNGWWYLRDQNSEGDATQVFSYGAPGDIPICGHWAAPGGPDTVGVYRNGTFYLRLSNTPGNADLVFRYGDPGDTPVVGDWNGDGIDTVAVFRSATWYFSNVNGSVVGSSSIRYGDPGDTPVSGDWTKKGFDSVGVFRAGTWFFSNSVTSGFADTVSSYGNPSDKPLVGDFDHDGYDTPGIARGSYWWLSNAIGANAAVVFPYG